MRAMKFKVDNELQSKLLQQELFKNGYLWRLGEESLLNTPRFTTSKYLFAHPQGHLTQCNHPDSFNLSRFKHCETMSYIGLSDYRPISYNNPNNQIILVEVLGDMYDKKELQSALSNLTRYSLEK